MSVVKKGIGMTTRLSFNQIKAYASKCNYVLERNFGEYGTYKKYIIFCGEGGQGFKKVNTLNAVLEVINEGVLLQGCQCSINQQLAELWEAEIDAMEEDFSHEASDDLNELMEIQDYVNGIDKDCNGNTCPVTTLPVLPEDEDADTTHEQALEELKNSDSQQHEINAKRAEELKTQPLYRWSDRRYKMINVNNKVNIDFWNIDDDTDDSIAEALATLSSTYPDYLPAKTEKGYSLNGHTEYTQIRENDTLTWSFATIDDIVDCIKGGYLLTGESCEIDCIYEVAEREAIVLEDKDLSEGAMDWDCDLYFAYYNAKIDAELLEFEEQLARENPEYFARYSAYFNSHKEAAPQIKPHYIIDFFLLSFTLKVTATVIELYCAEIAQSNITVGDMYDPDYVGTRAMHLGFDADDLMLVSVKVAEKWRNWMPGFWIDAINYCIEPVQPIVDHIEALQMVEDFMTEDTTCRECGGSGQTEDWDTDESSFVSDICTHCDGNGSVDDGRDAEWMVECSSCDETGMKSQKPQIVGYDIFGRRKDAPRISNYCSSGMTVEQVYESDMENSNHR